MKVEMKSEEQAKVRFEDIASGDCFRLPRDEPDEFYIKGDEYDEDDNRWCLQPATGVMIAFPNDDQVVPVFAKVVILNGPDPK